jgi:hypothetical protein
MRREEVNPEMISTRGNDVYLGIEARKADDTALGRNYSFLDPSGHIFLRRVKPFN